MVNFIAIKPMENWIIAIGDKFVWDEGRNIYFVIQNEKPSRVMTADNVNVLLQLGIIANPEKLRQDKLNKLYEELGRLYYESLTTNDSFKLLKKHDEIIQQIKEIESEVNGGN